MKETGRVLPEITTKRIETVVSDILKGDLSDTDERLVQEKKTY